MLKDRIIVGIDLGTSYSCISFCDLNKPEIIPNKMGGRITPTIICFKGVTKNEICFGDDAKNIGGKHVFTTIYDIKRLIGRKFSDKEVQNDINNKIYSFEILDDGKNKPIIKISNYEKNLYPEEILAMIIKNLINDAETFLGKKVKDVIITVPANFNNSQRESTKNAGKMADLNVIKLINEPTSAALAYVFFKNIVKRKKKNIDTLNDEHKILVFDLGGGTLDISILKVNENLFEVICTKGNNHLGGNDFDNKLVDFCVKDFEKETGINLKHENNKESINSLYKLKVECEKTKIDLSTELEAKIDIEHLYKNKNFECIIQRYDFEFECKDLFKECMNIVEELLSENNIKKSELEEIILIGGSTKIPKIREMIKIYFNKEIDNTIINPDEAVALGAAIEGANLLHQNDNKTILLDINPFPFGIANDEGKMVELIPKGNIVPTTTKKIFFNSFDYQTSVGINIYEGHYNDVKNNHKVGYFSLINLPKKKKGELEIEVTFNIDTNNILHVSAREISTGINKAIEIKNDSYFNAEKIKESKEKIFELFGEKLNENINFKNELIKLEKQYNFSKNIDDLKLLITAFENFIKIFDKNFKDNEMMKEKYNFYVSNLFKRYNQLFANDHEEIKKKEQNIINFLKIMLMNNISIEYFINIIDDINLKNFLLIENIKFCFEKGNEYFEIEKKKESNYENTVKYFNQGLNSIPHKNNAHQVQYQFQNLKNLLLFNIDKAKAKHFYEEGEICLKKGDVENNKEEYIKAIDYYQNAIKIIQEKEDINIDLKKSIFGEKDNTQYFMNLNIFKAKIIYKLVYVLFEKLNDKSNLYKLRNKIKFCKELMKSEINYNEDWYNNLEEINIKIIEEIENINEKDLKDINQLKERMKKEFPLLFENLEQKENEPNIEYIKYIIETYPTPKNSIQTRNDIENEFNNRPKEFIKKLLYQYHPNNFPKENMKEKKMYCIYSQIYEHLTCLNNKYNNN